ncbi:MAG: glycosyltransferase family 2 protein [Planctomycetes bacterium]|nr:glycosyltransferase family 2 protein [Planctomycetota bacterium]
MVAGNAAPVTDRPVSVLIPVYQRPVLVRRAVDSALAQTHGNLEIIVIDNASTDATWEVVNALAERDGRVRCFRNDTNLGPVRSWIRGLEQCRGDYVKILWSDDWMSPTCVAESLVALAEHPGAGIVFTSTFIHDGQTPVPFYHFPNRRWITAEAYFAASIQDGSMPVSPGCTLVQRNLARFRVDFPRSPSSLAGMARSLVASRAGLAATRDGHVLREIALSTGAGSDMLFIWDAVAASGGIVHLPKFLNHFDRSPTSITVTQGDRVAGGYRLAARWFLDTSVADSAMRRRLRMTWHEAWPKRWERTVRRAVRRTLGSLRSRWLGRAA